MPKNGQIKLKPNQMENYVATGQASELYLRMKVHFLFAFGNERTLVTFKFCEARS